MSTKTKTAASETVETTPTISAVATTQTGNNVIPFPQDLDLEADAGSGMENMGKDDLALPFFSILQDLSPQTKKSKAEYVEGAKPGMFYNSVTKALYDGEKGVIWVPALYAKTFIEWVPNQGGFVKDHGPVAGAKLAETCTRTEKGGLRLPNGNDLVETAYHFGLIVEGDWVDGEFQATGAAQEALFTLKSSGLKVSRRWNSLAAGIKLQGKNGPFTPALPYGAYKLTTKEVSNDEGTWSQLEVAHYKPTPGLTNGANIYKQAIAFGKAMSDKALPVDQTTAGEPAAGGSDADKVSDAF